MAERLSAQQWSDYWKQGTLTSFHGHFQGNYDGPIRQFWEDRFALLPPGSQILDLATGNGAVALLAAEYSRRHQRDFTITAIDFAQINAPQPPSNIRFISYCPMEETGLEDSQFDLITSQFGFEYGNTTRALNEIRRLIKPTGYFSALMHHADSAILDQAKEALQQTKRCEKSGLTQIATQLALLQERLQHQGILSAKEQQQAQHLHQALRQGIEKLQRHAATQTDPSHLTLFTESILKLFSRQNAQRFSPQQRIAALQKLKDDNQYYRNRMKDLYSSSITTRELKHIISILEAKGFIIHLIQGLHYRSHLFCHSLVSQLYPRPSQ